MRVLRISLINLFTWSTHSSCTQSSLNQSSLSRRDCNPVVGVLRLFFWSKNMNINVFRRAILLDHEDDTHVQGIYQVSFDKAYSDVPESKLASMALDLFHNAIGIKCLDDFEISVIDDDDEPITQDLTHETYSFTAKGTVDKIADFGIDLYGSDAELSVEQLDEKYNPDGDGEHYQFTREQWREAVSQNQTASDYWTWLKHVLVMEAEQDETAV